MTDQDKAQDTQPAEGAEPQWPARQVAGSPSFGYTDEAGNQREFSADGGWVRPTNAAEAQLVEDYLAAQEAQAEPELTAGPEADEQPAKPAETKTKATKTAGPAGVQEE